MNRCEDYPCCGHTDGSTCPPQVEDNTRETACCENAYDEGTNDIPGRMHDGECDNYDGAPVHQWEYTTPDAVYDTDEWESPFMDDYGRHGGPLD